jgi:glycosyltransferase involved in cell wall biosynthesis
MLARLACAASDRVICVNEEIADSVENLGVPHESIEIAAAFLPISVNPSHVPEELMQWMSSRSPVISTVLFFRPEYGFDVLVRAVAMLRRSHPRIGCVVMGSGEGRREAEQMIGAEGLQDSFRLTGDLDHRTCLAAMSRSTAFVRPNYQDGDSISVREAVSLGLPVVASNVGTRPVGTLLFEAGDVNGLVRAIDHAVGARAA